MAKKEVCDNRLCDCPKERHWGASKVIDDTPNPTPPPARHTPGLRQTYDCGCTAEATEFLGKPLISLVRCDTHNAAPALASALQRARVGIRLLAECHVVAEVRQTARLDLATIDEALRKAGLL